MSTGWSRLNFTRQYVVAGGSRWQHACACVQWELTFCCACAFRRLRSESPMNNPLQSPMNAPIIAFLTDFGLDDPYVGIMKGVVLGLCPQARLVDVSHGVKPQNITQAAFMLEAAYRYFPPGTIFVCVVDPGVGSSRSAVALQAHGYTFVGPNNGLFSEILMEDTPFEAVELTNQAYQLPSTLR